MGNFIDGIMQNIANVIDNDIKPYADIVFGSDPPVNGICMIQGPGAPEETHLDKAMVYRLPVVLNGKNKNQLTLLSDLTRIHAELTTRLNYQDISTADCQVKNIATTAAPSIIGREQNNQWICGSSLEVSFYWRKD